MNNRINEIINRHLLNEASDLSKKMMVNVKIVATNKSTANIIKKEIASSLDEYISNNSDDFGVIEIEITPVTSSDATKIKKAGYGHLIEEDKNAKKRTYGAAS